jgi:peptidoglycan glycosyltransferase
MALATATIARGGEMPAPYLVAEVEQGADRTVLHRPGAVLRRVLKPTTAAALNSMMVLSVDTAYASPARIPGVRVGGKTGTAEVGGGATPHAWFVGYAPADRPGVAVAVIMENRGSGTTFATPAARQVLEAALRLGY